MTSSIRRLDASSARMLGAGQAITDVARVVKEGLENALDAGANKVVIRLVRFGLDRISIEDNGCGIPLLEGGDLMVEQPPQHCNDPQLSTPSMPTLKTTLLESRSTTKYYRGLHGNEEKEIFASPNICSSVSPQSSSHCETSTASSTGPQGQIKEEEPEKMLLESGASSLQTLGFRGEALHALAQVSLVEIDTMHETFQPFTCRCRYDPFEASRCHARGVEYHTQVSLVRQGGRTALGTTLVASDLFKILPVRHRDAEKQRRAQLLQAVALVKQYAISHPWIQLCLTHQEAPPHGQTVTMVSLRGCSAPSSPHPSAWWSEQLLSRGIADAYGGTALTRLQPVSWVLTPEVPLTTTEAVLRAASRHSNGAPDASPPLPLAGARTLTRMKLHVRGFVWKLEAGGRATRDWQIWVVDGRLMDLPRWTKALDSAYRSCLPHASQSRHSAFFLHVWSDTTGTVSEEGHSGAPSTAAHVDEDGLPGESRNTPTHGLQYDVNLSPDKRQVLMVNEQACAEALHQTAKQTFWSWSEGVQEMVSRSSALLQRNGSNSQQKGGQATPWLSVVESTLHSPAPATSSDSPHALFPGLAQSFATESNGISDSLSFEVDDEEEQRHMRLALRMQTEVERSKLERQQCSEKRRLDNAPISFTSYVWRRDGTNNTTGDTPGEEQTTSLEKGSIKASPAPTNALTAWSTPRPSASTGLFSMKAPKLLLNGTKEVRKKESDHERVKNNEEECDDDDASDHRGRDRDTPAHQDSSRDTRCEPQWCDPALTALIKTISGDMGESEEESDDPNSRTSPSCAAVNGTLALAGGSGHTPLHSTLVEENLMPKVQIVYDDDVACDEESCQRSDLAPHSGDEWTPDRRISSEEGETRLSGGGPRTITADNGYPVYYELPECFSLETLWNSRAVKRPSDTMRTQEEMGKATLDGSSLSSSSAAARARRRKRSRDEEENHSHSGNAPPPRPSGEKKKRGKKEATASYLIGQDEHSLHNLFTKTSFLEMEVHGQFNMGFIIGSVMVGESEEGVSSPASPSSGPRGTPVVSKETIEVPEEKKAVFPTTTSTTSTPLAPNPRRTRVLIVVDQHASDEKANYERLLRDYVAKPQPLVVPVTLSLDAEEVRLALLYKEELQQRHGFQVGPVEHEVEIEIPSGEEALRQGHVEAISCESSNAISTSPSLQDAAQSVKREATTRAPSQRKRVRLPHPTQLNVYAIPLLPYDKVHPTDIAELLQHLQRYGSLSSCSVPPAHSDASDSATTRPNIMLSSPPALQLKAVWHSLATKACRSSIMIGTVLPHATMCRIVRRLSELDHPWCCPHGRPTLRCLGEIETDWAEHMPSRRLDAFYQRCRDGVAIKRQRRTERGRNGITKVKAKKSQMSTQRGVSGRGEQTNGREGDQRRINKRLESNDKHEDDDEEQIMDDGGQNTAASAEFLNFHFDFNMMAWTS